MARRLARSGLARSRLLDAALELFAERGVDGTSLQVIADHLGVSKAAVYYQFQTKEDMVLAVLQPFFDDVARLVRIAESIHQPESRRDATIGGFIELVIRNRQLGHLVYGDPAVLELIRGHQELVDCRDRLHNLLLGSATDIKSRVTVAMITAGIVGCSADPRLRDIPEPDLHRITADCAQHLLAVPPTHRDSVDVVDQRMHSSAE
ncbi:TetR/AcrR family transcriptional regulator [Mycobacterium sp. smrl_JER01]|uniref:TetR/AcrR family transcriptional regulator n=1 Tax=Mycobacterium sp. smrl_JER01 TaxID=3402633 RepID=UPI003AD57EB6